MLTAGAVDAVETGALIDGPPVTADEGGDDEKGCGEAEGVEKGSGAAGAAPPGRDGSKMIGVGGAALTMPHGSADGTTGSAPGNTAGEDAEAGEPAPAAFALVAGVATDGVAADGVATDGVATDGVAAAEGKFAGTKVPFLRFPFE